VGLKIVHVTYFTPQGMMTKRKEKACSKLFHKLTTVGTILLLVVYAASNAIKLCLAQPMSLLNYRDRTLILFG